MSSPQESLHTTKAVKSAGLTPQTFPIDPRLQQSENPGPDFGINPETGDLFQYPSPDPNEANLSGGSQAVTPPAPKRRARKASESGGRAPKRARHHQSDNEEGDAATAATPAAASAFAPTSAFGPASTSSPAPQPAAERLYKTTEAHRQSSVNCHKASADRELEKSRELHDIIPPAFQSDKIIRKGGVMERIRAIDEAREYIEHLEERNRELERVVAGAGEEEEG